MILHPEMSLAIMLCLIEAERDRAEKLDRYNKLVDEVKKAFFDHEERISDIEALIDELYEIEKKKKKGGKSNGTKKKR